MSLLERVQDINTRFPLHESIKYSTTLIAEQALEEYRKEPEPSPELTYAVIRMLRAFKRYPEALALMVERRPTVKGVGREVEFYEIELHFLAGQREVAERLLAAFNAAGHKLRPSWKRSLDKLSRSFETRQIGEQLDAMEKGLAALELEVDLAAHLPLVQSVLPLANHALETLLFMRDRLRVIRETPTTAAPELLRFDKFHQGKLIFTCGFSWSGSGAVSCYLWQHKDVFLPFGMSEMAYLQGRAGHKGVGHFIGKKPLAAATMRKLLARFLIESLVVLRRPHYSVLQYVLAERSRAAVLGELVDEFARAMLTDAACESTAVRRRVLGKFLQRMFSVRGGQHILLNNVFLAPRTSLMNVIENAQFVVVERDARDQYVARKTESDTLGEHSMEQFAAMLAKGRDRFRKHRASLAPEQREGKLMVLRFEDFIADPDLRQQVLSWVGLRPEGLATDTARFDPSLSAKNIGIHAAGLTPSERAHAESQLGLYMP